MLRFLFFLLPALMLALPAGAAERLKGEHLIASPPPGWVRVLVESTGGTQTVSYVPEGESIEEWSQMISLQVLQGAALRPPDELAAEIFKGGGNCRENENKGPELSSVNGYQTALYRLFCSGPIAAGGEPLPEWVKTQQVSVFKGIWGGANAYMVKRVWHGDEPGLGYPGVDGTAWADFLNSVEVCNLRDINRSCRAFGILASDEAEVLARAARLSCPALELISLRPPDAGPWREPDSREAIELGASPFLVAEGERRLLETAMVQSLAGRQVLLTVGIHPSARKGLPEDHVRAREETLTIRDHLIANGLPPGYIRIAANPTCSTGR